MTTLPKITEGTTGTYSALLRDETGAVVPSTSLSAVRMTFYSSHTGAIVNGRTAQSVLNANGVSIDGAGLLAWKLMEADTILIDTPKPSLGHHRAVFVIEWQDAQAVQRQMVHEVMFPISRALNAPFV